MSILDNIHNYYESLVVESLAELTEGKTHETDFLIDVVCVTLNHLPPRYIRHEVDMIYYLSPVEAQEMRDKVRDATKNALVYVEEARRRE
jgi:late competence development protein ComFB